MRASEINVRTGQIVNAAMKVHTLLGPGLLEGVYEACLAHELRKRGFDVKRQVPHAVVYDGERIDLGYRLDLVIDDVVIVELKAVTKMLALYEAQLLSYLKSGKYPVGLLINFHSPRLKDGIKRLLSVSL